MGGLNSGSRAPKGAAPKSRGKPNHRSNGPVTSAKARGATNHRGQRAIPDKTAVAAAKAERARQELARRLAEPKMASLLLVIKDGRARIAKAVERVMARRAAVEAAKVAVPQ